MSDVAPAFCRTWRSAMNRRTFVTRASIEKPHAGGVTVDEKLRRVVLTLGTVQIGLPPKEARAMATSLLAAAQQLEPQSAIPSRVLQAASTSTPKPEDAQLVDARPTKPAAPGGDWRVPPLCTCRSFDPLHPDHVGDCPLRVWRREVQVPR